MVRLLTAMPIPVEEVLQAFQPDLPAIRLLFNRYTQSVAQGQLQVVGTYYTQVLRQVIQRSESESAAQLWFEMHHVYLTINQPSAAVDCLRRRVEGRPAEFQFRYALGLVLNDQQQFTEAEQQLKWCVQRRPDHEDAKAALARAVTGRVDQQTSATATPASYNGN